MKTHLYSHSIAYRLILLCLTSVILGGCANQPSSQLAESSAEQEAKKFATSPDYGNLYFVWPDYLDPLIQDFSGMKVTANGEVIGKMINNQFINVKAAPGSYTFTIDEYSDVYDGLNKTLTTFDITVAPNSLGIISCWSYPAVEKDIVYLDKAKGCANKKTRNGISYCGNVNNITSELHFSGFQSVHEDNLRCRLTNSKGHISEAKMVAGNKSAISNDGDGEFANAQTAGTAAAYQGFIKEYPASKHTVNANKEYERLVIAEASNAKEQKIRAKLERDKVLPLNVKKDKYMLTLTKHLNLQQYEESLFYFDLLDRLNIELSSSFDFFWGEALLRTDQPNAAIGKLYQYINKAGSQGRYYTKALELTNEAEANL